MCVNSAAHFDYISRFCTDDPVAVSGQTVECTLMGLSSQLESRTSVLQKLLQALQKTKDSVDPSTLHDSLLIAIERCVLAVAYMRLVHVTTSLILWKLYCDPNAMTTCIRLCNVFLPTLLKHNINSVVLKSFLQRYLEVISFTISTEAPIANPQSQEISESQMLALVVGDELMKLMQKDDITRYKHNSFATNVEDAERRFSSRVSICLLLSVTSDEKFLANHDYSVEELLVEIYDSFNVVSDFLEAKNCFVINTQTLVSAHTFIEMHRSLCEK